jgi:hypothetical protein
MMFKKRILGSKTVVAGLSVTIAGIAQMMNLTLSEAEAQDIALIVVEIAGGLLAVYGRLTATTEIIM